MSVVDAVATDLQRIHAVAPELAASAEAATALALAEALDSFDTSGAEKASCAGKLAALMATLRELTPAQEKGDVLDELNARRRKRTEGRAVS